MFDLKDWLREADISGADESLDTEAARLLVLNDALVNSEFGPLLAALIVTAPEGCGLDALSELANCSEPRLAMMAIVNLLSVFADGNLEECDFSIPQDPANPSGETEITIRKDDMPSEAHVRLKAAHVTTKMASLFVDRAAEGDYCCDFLTFLLTALMDLTSKGGGENREVVDLLESVSNEKFLKTIMRTWKVPARHQHLSQSDGDRSLNLGFLVTCYLISLCCTKVSPRLSGDSTGSDGAREPRGLAALIGLEAWAVKFFLMRIYDVSTSELERAHLLSVLNECAVRDPCFGAELLRLSILPAISFAAPEMRAQDDDGDGVMSHSESADLMRTTLPDLMIMITLVHNLLPGHVSPGEGVWFESRQSTITLQLSRALTVVGKKALRLAILSDFQDSSDGRLQRTAVMSLVAQLTFQIWRAGVAVLFCNYRDSLRPLWESFKALFGIIQSATEQFCHARDVEWEAFSRAPDMTPLRTGLGACRELASSAVSWIDSRANPDNRAIHDMTQAGLCEWCLGPSETELKTCGQCKRVAYCSVAHQRAHWKCGHKVECDFLRNCLEGSSIVVSRNGRVLGLIGEADEAMERSTAVPFGRFVMGQRKELLMLGFRMPGVLSEINRTVGELPEVSYTSLSRALRRIVEESAPDVSEVNFRVAGSLMRASRHGSILYMSKRLDVDRGLGSVSLLCSGTEHSQSVSFNFL